MRGLSQTQKLGLSPPRSEGQRQGQTAHPMSPSGHSATYNITLGISNRVTFFTNLFSGQNTIDQGSKHN